MSKKGAIPDAWDDDWERLADTTTKTSPEEGSKDVKLSKAERKALHAQANKQLWEAAESPEPQPFFLAARNTSAPVNADFKPTIKVLTRKPPPQILSRDGVIAGMAGLKLDDDDSEEEERKKAAASFAERQARAQREREEKQRKYEEVRERLFGPSNTPSDDSQGRSSPSNRQSRGKGRGRGQRDNSNASSADPSPARSGNNSKKQLYDPSYSAKPNSIYIQRREAGQSSPRPQTPNENQPIRAPRGPDNSGGFGRGGGRGFGNPP